MTQLVLCFDGTNNNITGGFSDTNVAKLCKALVPNSDAQLLYYDPGVGNAGALPGATFVDRVRGKLDRLWGLALGRGIYENIAEAYLFLIRNWKPGDRIYVYGFSRGAFTARSVAGMVARFGILRPAMEGMLPTLVHLYFADPTRNAAQYKAIQAEIAAVFCEPAGAVAEVWFIGVWDTVESVGSPLSRQRISVPPTIIGKRFRHVRQILALDEYRRSFQPRPYYIHPTYPYAANGQTIAQVWWRGAHCDVGGGYPPDEAELSDESLLWMLDESIGRGLLVDPALVGADGKLDRNRALALIRGASPGNPRTPLAHSEVFIEPYWALTGLGVRRFDDVEGAPGDPPAAPPVAHQVTSAPVVPVWSRPRRPDGKLLLALIAALLFFLVHGCAVSGATLLQQMKSWTDLPGLWSGITALSQANADLARWQLAWWRSGSDALASLPDAAHPVWMFVADLGLILSYGYLLARGLARGFAKAAGLRQLGQPHPRLLNLLGMSGVLIVGADVVEDLLMLVVMAFGWLDWTLLQDFAAVLMSVASAVKWLGLLPAAMLILRR